MPLTLLSEHLQFLIASNFLIEDLDVCSLKARTKLIRSLGAFFIMFCTFFLPRSSTSNPCSFNQFLSCITEFGFSKLVNFCKVFLRINVVLSEIPIALFTSFSSIKTPLSLMDSLSPYSIQIVLTRECDSNLLIISHSVSTSRLL